MKPKTYQSDKKTGFTIIELLTVMSIIVILIGLLVPSLQMVKRYAKEVRQRAQFHSIEAAMEFFSNDSGGGSYPPSDYIDENMQRYPGAARLCEAMVGQDLMGFHPNSRFRADCTIDGTNKLYDNPPVGAVLYPDTDTNLRARRGPYLQPDNANAYRLSDIYGAGGTGDITPESLFVLGGVYGRVTNKTTGKKIGMPILYYKADTSGVRHDPNNPPTPAGRNGNIYNYVDNDDIVGLGMPWNPTVPHPMYADPKVFYMNTKNEKISKIDGWPYRADSYILISAGFDGQYGTSDDIFNFEK
jgi:prepilin-type N-terminal cleavage/methylation domain-containing protein